MPMNPMTVPAASSSSAFPLWIAGVCVAVVVYASLQPFTGWTELAPNTRFFLWHLGQRWTPGDVAFNFFAYVPLTRSRLNTLTFSSCGNAARRSPEIVSTPRSSVTSTFDGSMPGAKA